MNKCLNCGKKVKNKYCSVSCQNKHQCKGKKLSEEHKKKLSEVNKKKRVLFDVSCFKCNKKFRIEEYDVSKPKKKKYYCSRSCANSRNWSEKDKKKKSESAKKSEKVKRANKENARKKREDSLKKKINKSCSFCGIKLNQKTKKKYCSSECKTKAWSQHHKKLYHEGKNYVAGGTTNWYNYGNIKVQGTYEIRACVILDKQKDNGIINNWEYTNDKFNYIGVDGNTHTYLLDFKLTGSNNNIYYIETKGWVKNEDYNKWKAVEENGYRLDVWYLNNIESYEKELNIKKENWEKFIK